jgi:hypothetical protein
MHPLLLASCLPAGCRVTPVVAPLPPFVLSTHRLRLSSSRHAALQQATSTLQRAAASCLRAPLLLFASLLLAGSHITSHCATTSSVHP